ncbi:MAG: response regulator [Syntrophales bacterium]|nr:response regulator [Syntrophales bacterium]MDD5532327.1 response regulator [Syntrophales bacterium]HPL63141.1 response regulator [Syntrophales bacterium]
MEKILIVDDEVHVLNLLRKFFASRGYDVHTATTGETAIEIVRSEHPEIVLLDIIMPGMGGLEVLQEIRKIDPDIGVIMATAVLDQKTAKVALEMGAYDYVTKPFDFDYMETVLLVKLAGMRFRN